MSTHRIGHVEAGEERLQELLDGTLAGDRGARESFLIAVESFLQRIAARPRVTGRLSREEDERRNVVLQVIDRLCAGDFERLRRYRELREVRRWTLRAWLTTTTRRAAANYRRARLDLRRRGDADADEIAARALDPTRRIDARLILALAHRVLTREQLDVVLLHLQDRTRPEIAVELGLPDEAAADRLLESAFRRLRRHVHAPVEAPKGRGGSASGKA